MMLILIYSACAAAAAAPPLQPSDNQIAIYHQAAHALAGAAQSLTPEELLQNSDAMIQTTTTKLAEMERAESDTVREACDVVETYLQSLQGDQLVAQLQRIFLPVAAEMETYWMAKLDLLLKLINHLKQIQQLRKIVPSWAVGAADAGAEFAHKLGEAGAVGKLQLVAGSFGRTVGGAALSVLWPTERERRDASIARVVSIDERIAQFDFALNKVEMILRWKEALGIGARSRLQKFAVRAGLTGLGIGSFALFRYLLNRHAASRRPIK